MLVSGTLRWTFYLLGESQEHPERLSVLFLFLNGKLYTGALSVKVFMESTQFLLAIWGQMTNVSSTYWTQSLGRSGADWMVLCSRSFMNRFAMMG